MAAQAGKNIYIQFGTGTGTETVAALRSTGLNINGQLVDVTTRDSAGWREAAGSMGVVSASVKGDGVLTDGTGHNSLVSRSIAQSVDAYTIVFGNGDKLVGNFQLTQFEAKGNYNGEQLFSISLESAGSLTFTGT